MSDSVFSRVQEAAEYLRLELTSQEMAEISVRLGFGEDGINAVASVFDYLRDKKKEQIVSTLLRMSRLPLKEPKTFANFDFDTLHGRQADSLKDLPTLSALHAH